MTITNKIVCLLAFVLMGILIYLYRKYPKQLGIPRMKNPPAPPEIRKTLVYEIEVKGSLYQEMQYAKQLEQVLLRLKEMGFHAPESIDIKLQVINEIKEGKYPPVTGLQFKNYEAAIIQAYIEANKERYPDDADAYQAYWENTILPRVHTYQS